MIINNFLLFNILKVLNYILKLFYIRVYFNFFSKITRSGLEVALDHILILMNI